MSPVRIPRRLRKLARRTGRGLAVAVALAAYVIAQVGFPVLAHPDGDPVSGHVRACGCTVQDECDHCCGACGHDSGPSRPVCCAGPKTPACCVPAPDGELPPCCRAKARAEAARVTWVIGPLSQRCRGVQTLWVGLAASLPAPARVGLVRDDTPGGRAVTVAAVPPVRVTSPDDPPPRS